MAGGTEGLQKLVSQEARAVTGCFRTANLGALGMDLGPTSAQPDNRQRRLGLRLLSLPKGDQARTVVGATSAIGKRLEANQNQNL